MLGYGSFDSYSIRLIRRFQSTLCIVPVMPVTLSLSRFHTSKPPKVSNSSLFMSSGLTSTPKKQLCSLIKHHKFYYFPTLTDDDQTKTHAAPRADGDEHKTELQNNKTTSFSAVDARHDDGMVVPSTTGTSPKKAYCLLSIHCCILLPLSRVRCRPSNCNQHHGDHGGQRLLDTATKSGLIIIRFGVLQWDQHNKSQLSDAASRAVLRWPHMSTLVRMLTVTLRPWTNGPRLVVVRRPMDFSSRARKVLLVWTSALWRRQT